MRIKRCGHRWLDVGLWHTCREELPHDDRHAHHRCNCGNRQAVEGTRVWRQLEEVRAAGRRLADEHGPITDPVVLERWAAIMRNVREPQECTK